MYVRGDRISFGHVESKIQDLTYDGWDALFTAAAHMKTFLGGSL